MATNWGLIIDILVEPKNNDSKWFKMSGLVEYCDECSHFGKSINDKPMCFKIKKELDEAEVLDLDEGIIPKWCRLPKD